MEDDTITLKIVCKNFYKKTGMYDDTSPSIKYCFNLKTGEVIFITEETIGMVK